MEEIGYALFNDVSYSDTHIAQEHTTNLVSFIRSHKWTKELSRLAATADWRQGVTFSSCERQQQIYKLDKLWESVKKAFRDPATCILPTHILETSARR
jgi:hypothetical protein